MKTFSIRLQIFLCCILSLSSCSKKEIKGAPAGYSAQELRPPYDTLAKDSFSPGAVPEQIFQNLRVNSKPYQDSLAKKKLEELAAQKDLKKKDSVQKLVQKTKEKTTKTEKDKKSDENSQPKKETELSKSE